ncbi:MAG: hypothetical protein QF662_06335, partial [Phycisphaerae bacterium]|nr:hypothetical protein [Phycisphaerae bacterium]
KLPVTLLASARGLADAAAGQGYDVALKEHIAAWDEIWKTDIVIDGPREDQLLLRACAYYTIGAVHEDEPYGATACGLTETLYGGGVFGDQEIFVLPAVMVMYPPLAASMLQYRHNVIPMSRDLRKARGLSKGAEYAWDARWDGGEHTSPPYSENRRVTAYVGYAAWRYYLATRDLKWLETVGWPILSETADYWSVRVTHNREKDRYEVHKVMPPTEAPMPTYLVNNNSYTSGYVRMNMLSAIAAAKALGKKPPTKWVEVADKLYLAVDKERKMYRFHDSVNPAKPPHMADVHWMIYPMEHFAGDVGTARVVRDFTGRKVAPGKVTDADRKFAVEVRQAIADYYFAKTRPGFYSLTAGQNAGVYNDLNHREGAYKEFMSWKKSVGGPFYVANEMRGGGNPGQDVFLSGTGAYLTIAVYGLAGMRLRPEGIQFNPLLPDEWKSMTLKNFHFGSGVYDVKITPGDKMKIKLVSGKKDVRIFRLNGKTLSGP